jgi:hypothetical protein
MAFKLKLESGKKKKGVIMMPSRDAPFYLAVFNVAKQKLID